MDLDQAFLGDEAFFAMVDLGELPPQSTLERASGLKSEPGPYATKLIERVERAWRTPFRELTCEQVRSLLGQQMGLDWLAEPILEFVERYPATAITNYPGEMGLLALRAAEKLFRFAPEKVITWLRGDFSWMDEAFGSSSGLRREAESALGTARRIVAAS